MYRLNHFYVFSAVAWSPFPLLYSQPLHLSPKLLHIPKLKLLPLNTNSPSYPHSPSLTNFKWDRKPSEEFKPGTWPDFILRDRFSILLQLTIPPAPVYWAPTMCWALGMEQWTRDIWYPLSRGKLIINKETQNTVTASNGSSLTSVCVFPVWHIPDI